MPINLGSSPPQAVQNEWDVLVRGPLHIKGWSVIGIALSMLLFDFGLLTARLWLCLRIQRRFYAADILATVGTVLLLLILHERPLTTSGWLYCVSDHHVLW